jgi:hypothetical protein
MTTLKVHNIESAPEASKTLLENLRKIRNDSWITAFWQDLQGYLRRISIHELFVFFNEEELTVVWQTINVNTTVTVYRHILELPQ